RVRQQPQRLIAVAREEYVIELLHFAALRAHRDLVRLAKDRGYRRAQPNIARERRDQLLHVLARAAADHLPGGPVVDAEEAVIREELDEEARRKAQHVDRPRGPDRRAHRDDVMLDEVARIVFALEIFTEARTVVEASRAVGGATIHGRAAIHGRIMRHG